MKTDTKEQLEAEVAHATKGMAISANSPATLGLLGSILLVGTTLGAWLLTTLGNVEKNRLISDNQATMAIQSLTYKIDALVTRVDRMAILERRIEEISIRGSEGLRTWVELFQAKNPSLAVPELPK